GPPGHGLLRAEAGDLRQPGAGLPLGERRAHRAARGPGPRAQAGAEPLARGAHEGRGGGSAPAPAQVLFLDEPTIGLDVTMQKRIRQFIADYNRRQGAAVLLTSHYMADVQALCKRVIVIHHGRLLFDGALSALSGQFAAYKTIGLTAPDESLRLEGFGEVVNRDGDRIRLRASREVT